MEGITKDWLIKQIDKLDTERLLARSLRRKAMEVYDTAKIQLQEAGELVKALDSTIRGLIEELEKKDGTVE